MKKILLISITNEISPALRYRGKYILDLLESEGKIEYKKIYFYSNETVRAMNGKGIARKIYLVLKDLINIIKAIKKESNIYDYLFIKTYVFPFGGDKIEQFIVKNIKYKKLIIDIDDAVYMNKTRKQNKVLKKFRNVEKKIGFWVNSADKIILPNEIIIDDIINLYNVKQKKIVRYLTCPFKKQYLEDEKNKIEKNEDIIKFIWLGSPHTEKNLSLIENFIKNIKKIIENAEVILIGNSDEFDLFRDLEYVKFIKWNEENEKKYMRSAHFGLNPLVCDEFEKRKSAFKVIQYYRAGIFPIVSDVGINRRLIEKYGGLCIEEAENIKDGQRLLELYRSYSEAIWKKNGELTLEQNKEIFFNECIK